MYGIFNKSADRFSDYWALINMIENVMRVCWDSYFKSYSSSSISSSGGGALARSYILSACWKRSI